MNKLSRTIILSALIILATIGVIKVMVATAPEENKSDIVALKKVVKVEPVHLKSNMSSLDFSGRISAFEKMDLYSEVSGVLLSGEFREGVNFKKGEVIYQLDASEFSNNLKSQKSQLLNLVAASLADIKIDFPDESKDWDLFLESLDLNNSLPLLPVLKDQKLKRFISGKGILNSYFAVKSLEDKLSKFKLVAPFDGTLITANAKKGSLIKPGQNIGTFINPAVYELETEVSLSDLNFVKAGYQIQLSSDDLEGEWTGVVKRINSSIDASTQLLKVYVEVRGLNLREGMFLSGSSEGVSFEKSIAVNRKLISNGGVYLVNNGKITHQEVEVLHKNKSIAIVRGLLEGDLLIADNMKGIFEGLEVETIQD